MGDNRKNIMIKKLKLVSILAALLVVGCVTAAPALAVDEITYNADTTYTFTGGDVTVLSGSQATQVANSATAFTITITNPDVFTVRSANRYTFTIATATGTYLTSCGTTFSEVAIQPASGVTETGLTITPTTTVCSSVSGGGGGGTPPPPAADTTAPSNVSVVINSGASVTNTGSVTLALSATDSVGVTQMQISNDSVFTGATWEAYATSKSWTLTSGNGAKTVYARFRDAAANTSVTASDMITLDSGAVVTPPPPSPVPPTPPAPVPPGSQAAVMVQLQAQINALIAQINAIISAQGGTRPAECSAPLTAQLNFGLRHREVTCLQAYLRANGYLNVLPTGYFGTLTRAAIQRFQAQKGIAVQGNAGFGIVGPRTRASINASLGF